MRVVGLDWAVNPSDRAAVALEPTEQGSIAVVQVLTPVNNQSATDICKCVTTDLVAVDIPFAWPREFRDFVSSWTPCCQDASELPVSTRFRYRLTDRFVHAKTDKWPLSVSTNLFALGAREWATLVHAHQLNKQMAVCGEALSSAAKPHIVEVYAGATLKVFENDDSLNISGASTRISEQGDDATEKNYSYKTDEIARRALVEAIVATFHIQITDPMIDQIVSTGKKDHATDALLAGLTGLMLLDSVDGWGTWRPDSRQIEDAKAEGWIFFPRRFDNSEER